MKCIECGRKAKTFLYMKPSGEQAGICHRLECDQKYEGPTDQGDGAAQ